MKHTKDKWREIQAVLEGSPFPHGLHLAHKIKKRLDNATRSGLLNISLNSDENLIALGALFNLKSEEEKMKRAR